MRLEKHPAKARESEGPLHSHARQYESCTALPCAGILLSELKPAISVPDWAPQWVRDAADRVAAAVGRSSSPLAGDRCGENAQDGREMERMQAARGGTGGERRGAGWEGVDDDEDDEDDNDPTAGLLGTAAVGAKEQGAGGARSETRPLIA